MTDTCLAYRLKSKLYMREILLSIHESEVTCWNFAFHLLCASQKLNCMLTFKINWGSMKCTLITWTRAECVEKEPSNCINFVMIFYLKSSKEIFQMSPSMHFVEIQKQHSNSHLNGQVFKSSWTLMQTEILLIL